jgi:hypothetical protein
MTTSFQKLKRLNTYEKAYIAGFLDGDGCINAQIIPRNDYLLKFQIRVSVTFFQKTTRHWFLLQLQKQLNYGTLRKRPDGMSEYTILGKESVKHCIELLKPYLRLKKRHAVLILQIIEQLKKAQEPQAFLKLCEKVDKFQELNDSKKRKITSETVRSLFLELDLLCVPVETI